MTIAGLWEKLASTEAGDERLPLRILASEHFKKHGKPMRVGIDAYMWIFELSQQPTRNPRMQLSNEELLNRLSMGFHSRIRDLIGLHLSFVFVFDGQYKAKKRRWSTPTAENGNSNTDPESETANEELQDPEYDYHAEYVAICNRLRGDLKRGAVDFNSAPEIKIVQDLLKLWNISYIDCPGESEAELGRLNSCNVIDAIISNDADGFMYGAQTILKNFSKWLSDKPATQSNYGKSERYENEWFVTPYNIKKIESVTGLDKDRIIFVACLAGNDFSGGAKDLGITRCIQLAIVGTDKFKGFETKDGYEYQGYDFAKQLAKIYIPAEKHRYIEGKVSSPKAFRDRALKSLESTLHEEIRFHGDFYFGKRATKIELKLPTDYYFMIHFFPLFAPYLFQWRLYDTSNSHCNESLGRPKGQSVDCHDHGYRELANMPQLASLKYDEDADTFGVVLSASRYHTLNVDFVYNTTNDKYTRHGLQDIVTSEEDSASSWFKLPDFEHMCTFKFPIRRSIESFLVEHLTECYLTRILLAMTHSQYKRNEVYIDRYKKTIFPTKRMRAEEINIYCDENEPRKEWEEEQYQTKFSLNRLFLEYFTTEDSNGDFKELIDQELAQIGDSEKVAKEFIWIPKYLLEISEVGLNLIQDFDKREAEKAVSKKPPSKKQLAPVQKNNLFTMSFVKRATEKVDSDNLTKSPIKAPNSASFITEADDLARLTPLPKPHVNSPLKGNRISNFRDDTVQINPRNLNTPLAQLNGYSPSKRKDAYRDAYMSSEEEEDFGFDDPIFIDNTPLISKKKPTHSSLFVSDDDDDDDDDDDSEGNPFQDDEENDNEDFLSSARKEDRTIFFTPKKNDRIQSVEFMKEEKMDDRSKVSKEDVLQPTRAKPTENKPVKRRSPKKPKQLPKDQRKIDEFFKKGNPIEFFKRQNSKEIIEIISTDDDTDYDITRITDASMVHEPGNGTIKAKTVQEKLDELSTSPRTSVLASKKPNTFSLSDEESESSDSDNEADERAIANLLGVEF